MSCALDVSQIYSAKTFENQLGGWRSTTQWTTVADKQMTKLKIVKI